jgi:hypothetical protein
MFVQMASERNAMRRSRAFLMVLTIAMASALSAHSQGYTYVWTGGEPGFSGSITLDSPNSPTAGGSANDIMSATISIPEPDGTFDFSYPQLFFSPQSSINISGPFTWDSQAIVGMSIRYVPSSPGFDNLLFGTDQLGDDNPDGFTPGANSLTLIEDTGGSWQAVTAVPEPGASGLIASALGALICWKRLSRPH